MTTRPVWLASLVFGLLTIIAACSSGSPASPAPDNQTTLAPASPTDTPTPEAEPTPSIPSGLLAIFYRVTFGSNTDYLKGSGYNISWDNDTKGILRYIPETDQLDVTTRITSPSYARSSIYPVTLNGRLFSYRDWSDTNRWDVDKMDIVTGNPLSTNVFTAASFTIAGDRLFYRTPINRDLFGNPRGGVDL